MPWWSPNAHVDRQPLLRARGQIQTALRGWFAAEGFAEVETGILQTSPGNEAHLHAFATEAISPAGGRNQRYLRTSPEFACKKLLAAGERRIFEFARVFRNRERGALHQPEFTMLEWYRAEEPHESLMADSAALVALAAKTGGAREFQFRGRSADPFAAPERLTVAGAFGHHAGIVTTTRGRTSSAGSWWSGSSPT
jgi:elongation factor P--(R)-beta-lysine ligase